MDMSHANIPLSVHEAIEILTSSMLIQQIILFGSRAVGDHDPRSDVDIAIVAPQLTRSELALLRDRLEAVRTLYRISVTPLENMPDKLCARVRDQGVTIYER